MEKPEDILSGRIIGLTDKKLGLLLNFNVKRLQHGIKRIVNNL